MKLLPACGVANRALLFAATLALVSACTLAPTYERPDTPEPATFKEAPPPGDSTWLPAAPADALDRGPWWELFDDPVLSSLASQVEVSNQNVAAAVASYAQAQALVSQQRAALFPSIGLDGGATRSGGQGAGFLHLAEQVLDRVLRQRFAEEGLRDELQVQ